MPPSASTSPAKAKKPTVDEHIQSLKDRIDLAEGTLRNALGSNISREEVENLIGEGLQKMKAELAEKMSGGDSDYAMREFIDDQAAPRSLVAGTRNKHNEVRGELVRIEQGFSEAIMGAQATVAQFRTNINDRVNRVVETGNATQSRIRADLDELTVRVVSKSAAQEQQKMNVEDVMAKLAAHEVKLLEAEEREN